MKLNDGNYNTPSYYRAERRIEQIIENNQRKYNTISNIVATDQSNYVVCIQLMWMDSIIIVAKIEQ